MSQPCEVRRLARVTYENGLHIQQTLVSLRQQEHISDQLLLLEHPPVITLGRGGNRANLLASAGVLRENGVRFYETTRGGDITYHGPGQLVGYPILHMGEGSRDVRKYVTKVEEVLIRTVADYGITARRREGSRGVWVGQEKIAAIGVRIARWVTSHGFALNVRTNLDHFRLITPCGIRDAGVTSIQKITGREVDPAEVADRLVGHFSTIFERDLMRNDEVMRVVTVLPHDGDRLLLLHRNSQSGDFWQPVTGGINPGESAEAAAIRELAEETGFKARVVPLGLRQAFLIDPKYVGAAPDQLVFAEEDSFAAEVDSRQGVILDAEEHDRWRWFSFEEALENIRWSDDRETIETLQGMLRAVTA